ncbi:MAG: hypothetical protein N0C81_07720 [Candidatus Thiodiazotropha lotti]|uniref:Uncharacterized protein n=1 Tax=Candidatus Thiodiazotropha lotti TaxID=2792787 RepID=A0A9E4K5C2_9GAMM|nr:hypothetical protein [Candidatus Thiodiazotropha lotti]MCG7922652.1 hypothetical protein [Candidatus Thiodiazotropha lotti]MCG7932044.1 hypothetical protein [Candidatus Thiodiazotropha lotti]MCG7940011.1 hypothetical protein [Candidatus Thiodiazotropha lotti]MCG7988197.1 hypothetical protein [Candidatus Thiodiazotropha lotti]
MFRRAGAVAGKLGSGILHRIDPSWLGIKGFYTRVKRVFVDTFVVADLLRLP